MVVEDFTNDHVLGGRVRLRQPRIGFRAAIDAVLMAAAVPAVAGDEVLELGCGNGAAALCLATRVPGVRVTGLEADPDLAALANANVAANGLADRAAVVAGDLRAPPADLQARRFDHVMANPPHLVAGRTRASPDPGRAAAMVEVAGLGDWLAAAAAHARSRATLTLVHRADRLNAVLAGLADIWGDVCVFPLWPGSGRPAKRVIVAARKGTCGPLRLLPGLVLHAAGGGYSDAAEAILRGAAALDVRAA